MVMISAITLLSLSLSLCLLFFALSLLFVSFLRTRLCLPVLAPWRPYHCWDAAACLVHLCGRLLHTVRKGERERGREDDRFGSWQNNRKRKTGGNQKPVTTVTPILQFCTSLFCCLYKSYLINSGFALCYPHHFCFVWGCSGTKLCSWSLCLHS